MNNAPAKDHPEHFATKTGGYCKRCNKEHWLRPGNCLVSCQELIQQFDKIHSTDSYPLASESPIGLEISHLFGPARGKMFGLMECLKPDGSVVFLRAFSGQFNSIWQIDGWAPPLFDVLQFNTLTSDIEKKIKQLGREIDQCTPHSNTWLSLKKERRQLSQNLMQDIHNIYSLTNFRGETVSLSEAYIGNKGIPTGTGDCCAPKLLNFAAKNKLHPLGIMEFFWGQENKSGGRQHGSFHSSCVEKCQPILGFMLCGLDD